MIIIIITIMRMMIMIIIIDTHGFCFSNLISKNKKNKNKKTNEEKKTRNVLEIERKRRIKSIFYNGIFWVPPFFFLQHVHFSSGLSAPSKHTLE